MQLVQVVIGKVMSEIKSTVYYDGACPVCRREIGFYKRQDGGEQIEWIDVANAEECELPDGLSRETALKRFHVRKDDGQMVDGALAFAELWTRLPRFALAGRIARLPVIHHLLEGGYRLFLFVRRNSWRSSRRSAG